MKVHVYAPNERLAPFIERFTFVETADAEATKTLLPDTSVIAGFRYRGSAKENGVRVSDASLAGLRRSPRIMHTSQNAGVFLAQFREGEAGALFDHLPEGTGAQHEPEMLDRIQNSRSHAEMIAHFERWFFERHDDRRRDALIIEALKSLRAMKPLETISHELDLSRDRLEKRFRRAVGTTPKHFAAILRLKRAIALREKGASLTISALEAGYFDQSHFIRDFKQFTGEAPQKFFAAAEYC